MHKENDIVLIRLALFEKRERELIKRHYTRSWLIKIHKMFVRLSNKTRQDKGMARLYIHYNYQNSN